MENFILKLLYACFIIATILLFITGWAVYKFFNAIY